MKRVFKIIDNATACMNYNADEVISDLENEGLVLGDSEQYALKRVVDIMEQVKCIISEDMVYNIHLMTDDIAYVGLDEFQKDEMKEVRIRHYVSMLMNQYFNWHSSVSYRVPTVAKEGECDVYIGAFTYPSDFFKVNHIDFPFEDDVLHISYRLIDGEFVATLSWMSIDDIWSEAI